MLKTQTLSTESTWTENDVESTSPLTDRQSPPGTKTTVTTAEGESVKGKLRTKKPATKLRPAAAKETKEKTQPERKPAVATTSPPSLLKLRQIAKAPGREPPSQRTDVNVTATSNKNASAKSLRQTAAPPIRTPSRSVPSPPRPTTTAASTSSAERIATSTGTTTGPQPQACPTRSSALNTPGDNKATQTEPGNKSADSSTTQNPQAQRQPTAAERTAHRAKLLKSVFAAQMSTAIHLDGSFDQAAFRAYMDQLLIDAGNPTDPVERILIEQIAMAHLRVGDLSVLAAGSRGNESTKILTGATARLIGEVRKTALAISAYRARGRRSKKPSPASKKPKASR